MNIKCEDDLCTAERRRFASIASIAFDINTMMFYNKTRRREEHCLLYKLYEYIGKQNPRRSFVD